MKSCSRTKGFILLGMLVAYMVHAATPASTAYLESKTAVIQAEIDAIHHKLSGS